MLTRFHSCSCFLRWMKGDRNRISWPWVACPKHAITSFDCRRGSSNSRHSRKIRWREDVVGGGGRWVVGRGISRLTWTTGPSDRCSVSLGPQLPTGWEPSSTSLPETVFLASYKAVACHVADVLYCLFQLLILQNLLLVRLCYRLYGLATLSSKDRKHLSLQPAISMLKLCRLSFPTFLS